jgi:manganese efflux pump family protein
MWRIALFAGALLGAILVAGCAAQGASAPRGSTQQCTAYAYRAIERHVRVTGVPVACQGLSRAQVNEAASTAIWRASSNGSKSVWRRQAGLAAPWVSALLTGPVSVSRGAPAPPAAAPGGSRLGGVSEFAVRIAALLVWLATAAAGGYLLLSWLRAGGSLRRRTASSAPPAVTIGHAGGGLLGLTLWIVFMLTGWGPLAWVSLVTMLPVAGLGMGVLALGLPAAAAVAAVPAAPARVPVFVIAAHGLFAAAALLLVITAAIGGG